MSMQEQFEQERLKRPHIVHFDKVNLLTHESVIVANTRGFISIGVIKLDPNTTMILSQNRVDRIGEETRKIFGTTVAPTEADNLAASLIREMIKISPFEPLDIFSYNGMGNYQNPTFAKADDSPIKPDDNKFYRHYWHKICQYGIAIPFAYIRYKNSRR